MPIAGGQAALPRVFIAPLYPGARRFADFENDHGGPVRYFGQLLAADPRMRARVLDAGCGGDYPVLQLMRQALSRCRQLDGVDPDPIVWNHPRLTRRWCSTLEQSDVPAAAYDAVFTYNVLEHVRDARAFLAKACHVLKPGGVLYAFTPHAVHPFALCSRCVQVLGLRRIWSRHSRQNVNSYPAFYRCNRLGSILRAARDLDFESAEFHYVPALPWHNYFPAFLRFLPRLYDRLLTTRYRRLANLLILKLEKRGSGAGEGGAVATVEEVPSGRADRGGSDGPRRALPVPRARSRHRRAAAHGRLAS